MAFVTNIICVECGHSKSVTLADGAERPKLCYECQEKISKPINIMRVLYRQFQDALRNDEFDYIDFLLNSFNANNIEPKMLMAILTITLGYKKTLHSRSKFCDETRKTLTEQYGKDYTDKLMRGL